MSEQAELTLDEQKINNLREEHLRTDFDAHSRARGDLRSQFVIRNSHVFFNSVIVVDTRADHEL